MTSKPKSKGNSFERELARILSKTFNGNFQRCPTSGAFTGGSNRYRKEFLTNNQQKLFKGDIIPPDFMERLVIECKSYKDFQFFRLLREDNLQLNAWIEQTIDSADLGDFWIICMKFNNKGTFVLFQDRYLCEFTINNHFRYKSYVFTDLGSFLTENKDAILRLSQ